MSEQALCAPRMHTHSHQYTTVHTVHTLTTGSNSEVHACVSLSGRVPCCKLVYVWRETWERAGCDTGCGLGAFGLRRIHITFWAQLVTAQDSTLSSVYAAGAMMEARPRAAHHRARMLQSECVRTPHTPFALPYDTVRAP